MAIESSITFQINSILENFEPSNIPSIISLIKHYSSIFGTETVTIALHYLLKNVLSESESSGRDSKAALLSALVDATFFDSVNPFMHKFSRAFDITALSLKLSLETYPNFLETLFNRVNLSLDRQSLIALSITRCKDSFLLTQGQKFLETVEFLSSLCQSINDNTFSERVLQTLIFYFQKFEHVSPETKEKFISSVGEAVFTNKKIDKSTRLLLFRQNIFNYKTESCKEVLAKNNSVQSEFKVSFGIKQLALEIGGALFASEANFTRFLNAFDVKGEAAAARVISAFVSLGDDDKSLDRFPNLSLDQVCSVYSSLSNKKTNGKFQKRPSAATSSSRGIEMVISVMKKQMPKLNWSRVIDLFDEAELDICDRRSLENIQSVLNFLPSSAYSSFIHLLYKKSWTLRSLQFSLLKETSKKPTFFAMKTEGRVKTEPFLKLMKLFINCSVGDMTEFNSGYLGNFLCLDFVEALLGFEEPEFITQTLLLFEPLLETHFYFLFFVLSKTSGEGKVKRKLSEKLIKPFLHNKGDWSPVAPFLEINMSESIRVISKFQSVNLELIKPFFDLMETHNVSSPKGNELVWNIAKLIRKTAQFPDLLKIHFAIESFERSKVTEETFKNWVIQHKELVQNRILEVLSWNTCHCFAGNSKKTIAAIANVLHDPNFFIQIRSSGQPKNDPGAKRLFEKFYSDEISLEQLEERLLEQSRSEENIIGKLFDFMLREMDFYNEYSLKDLKKTSLLFKILIEQEKVEKELLKRFEQKTIAFLKAPELSKQFCFAAALLRFLVSWPMFFPELSREMTESEALGAKFPQTLSLLRSACVEQKVELLTQVPEPIFSAVRNSSKDETISSLKEIKSRTKSNDQQKNRDQIEEKVGKTVDKKEKNDAKHEKENERVKKQIFLMLNNLSESNYNETATFVDEKMGEEHHGVFAKYFVSKVARESKFLPMYVKFFRQLLNPSARRKITDSAYHNAKEVITPESVEKSSDNKQLINMGKWLGETLILANKPVLSRHIDLKELMLTAFFRQKQRDRHLLATVVFSSTVLGYCGRSQVFKPPNPWLMGLLSLLKEVYLKKEVEINVKFEIESLLTLLDIQISDIKIGYLLVVRNLKTQPVMPSSTSVFFKPEEKLNYSRLGIYEKDALGLETSYEFVEHYITDYMQSNVKMDSKTLSALKVTASPRLIEETVAKAVSRIFLPLVDRCVRISTMTVWGLMHKDFGSEPDPDVYEKNAMEMVESLVGNLTLVTCREPLRSEIFNNLCVLLTPFLRETSKVRNVAEDLTRKNFMVGCQVIAEISAIRARREVHFFVQKAVDLREKYKENALAFPGDPAIFGVKESNRDIYPNALPPDLQPKRDGLSVQQLALYANFSLLYEEHLEKLRAWTESANFRAYDQLEPKESKEEQSVDSECSESMQEMSLFTTETNVPLLDGKINYKQIWNFETIKSLQNSKMMFEYELVARQVKRSPDSSQRRFSELVPGESVSNAISKFCSFLQNECFLATESSEKRHLLLLLADHVYNEMFKLTSNVLFLDFSVVILKTIKESVDGYEKKLPSRLSGFYVCEKDRKKFCLSVFIRMVENGLFCLDLIDKHFAALMESIKPNMHTRSVYFMASFFNSMIVDKKKLNKDLFPRIVKVFRDIARQKYRMDNINHMAFEYFTCVEGLLDGSIITAPFKPVSLEENELHLSRAHSYLDKWEKEKDNYRSRAMFFQATEDSESLLNEQFFCALIEVLIREKRVDTLAQLIFEFVSQPKKPRVNALKRLLRTVIDLVLQGSDCLFYDSVSFHDLFFRLLRLFDYAFSSKSEIHTQILALFLDCFSHLRPLSAPEFATAWLALISNHHFLPPILGLIGSEAHRCHFHLANLFRSALSFMAQGQVYEKTPQGVEVLLHYQKGLSRLLWAISAAFPSFVAHFYYDLCDALSPSCVQMRNIVLSCVPKDVSAKREKASDKNKNRLYDYSKMSVLFASHPNVNRAWENYLNGLRSLKDLLDDFLKNADENTMSFGKEYFEQVVSELKPSERDSCVDCFFGQMKVDYRRVNAMTAYVCFYVLDEILRMEGRLDTDGFMNCFKKIFHFFLHISLVLDAEGAYLVVHALLNNVRYQNPHTHFFSLVVLLIFGRSNTEMKEIVFRVLFERLSGNGPHPEGLKLLFVELANNPTYRTISECFVDCGAEVISVFKAMKRRFPLVASESDHLEVEDKDFV